jgi:hypothetical protein
LQEEVKTILGLLSTAPVKEFIAAHEHDDERKLVLSKKDIFGVPAVVIAEQIAGRRKAKEKLETYYNNPGIVYPPGINLEQSSSEITAAFKRTVVEKEIHPAGRQTSGADLTGGFGVDSFFLSRGFSSFHYIEPNPHLLEIARHNHGVLQAGNITYHHTGAETFLSTLAHKPDFIFIDPSRRTENKKVLTLADSEPDIISLQEKVFEKTDLLLVKASPLLDIKGAIRALRFVKSVFVVSVENECKELLFLAEKSFGGEPSIHAVNIGRKDDLPFTFLFSEEERFEAPYTDPLTYLYEPNASILKAGAFKSVANVFNIAKLQASTHLYTSDTLIEYFPGRIFKIDARVKPHPKVLKEFFPEGKANITTRNYPLSVEDLKKKTGLKDGGERYLIGFSGRNEKFLVVAIRLK